jgi:hypothetical protein
MGSRLAAFGLCFMVIFFLLIAICLEINMLGLVVSFESSDNFAFDSVTFPTK